MTITSLKKKLLQLDIVEDNDYLILYCNLIISNISTKSEQYKTQRHHIIPQNYFRLNKLDIDNSADNIVTLAYRDHILAHYYLALCSKGRYKYSNQNAFFFLYNYIDLEKVDREYLDMNLDKFQRLYEQLCKNNSLKHQNKEPWNKGKSYSRKPTSKQTIDKLKAAMDKKYLGHIWITNGEETHHIDPKELDYYISLGYNVGRNDLTCNKKISQSQKLNPNRSMLGKHHSIETKEKMRAAALNVPKSDEAKKNMSKAHKGKILISNDVLKKSFYIEIDELNKYINEGYRKGRLLK